jgi:hypothetical protein
MLFHTCIYCLLIRVTPSTALFYSISFPVFQQLLVGCLVLPSYTVYFSTVLPSESSPLSPLLITPKSPLTVVLVLNMCVYQVQTPQRLLPLTS